MVFGMTANEVTQVFIGGWKNTGTRLVSGLLIQKGFDGLPELTNPMLDYRGMEFRSLFKALMLFDDHTLISLIENDTRQLDKWVIKHGHLMLIIPLLKRHFPRSRFICCVRNPLDILFKGNDSNYVEFGLSRSPAPPPLEKLETIRKWYDAALPHVDLMLKLEDLVFDKKNTIRKLFNFVGCDATLTADVLDIVGQPSATIGAGRGQFSPDEESVINEYAVSLGY